MLYPTFQMSHKCIHIDHTKGMRNLIVLENEQKKQTNSILTQFVKHQIWSCYMSECDGRGISHFGAPLTSPYY